MACESCGDKPKKCNKDFTKAVIEIDNPEQIKLMRRVVIPASMGDDTAVPPAVGKYHNVLLYYEANHKSYLYSSDGIPTLLANGLTDYEEAVNLPQINGVTLIGNKTLNELGIKTYFFDTALGMKSSTDLIAGDYAVTLGRSAINDGGESVYRITDTQSSSVYQEQLDNGLYASIVGNELKTSQVDLVPNNSSEAQNNFDKLSALIDMGYSLIVDNAYYIDTTEEHIITASKFNIRGEESKGVLKFIPSTTTSFFSVGNCEQISINNMTLIDETDQIVRFLRLRSTFVWHVKNFDFINNVVEGSIAILDSGYNPDISPVLGTNGFDYVKISDSKFHNIRKTPCFNLFDSIARKIEIKNNYVHNFTSKFFGLTITNGVPYGSVIAQNILLTEIDNNYVICDDDYTPTFSSSTTYYCFVLLEGNTCRYTNNHVEGLKSFEEIALYDAYLSVQTLYSFNNVWKNNMLFGPGDDYCLLKSKGGGAVAGDGTKRYYDHNTYIIEEDWQKTYDPDLNTHVFFIDLITKCSEYQITNCYFDITNLYGRNPAAPMEYGNLVFKDNFLRMKKSVMRPLFCARTQDEDTTIYIQNNVIIDESYNCYILGAYAGTEDDITYKNISNVFIEYNRFVGSDLVYNCDIDNLKIYKNDFSLSRTDGPVRTIYDPRTKTPTLTFKDNDIKLAETTEAYLLRMPTGNNIVDIDNTIYARLPNDQYQGFRLAGDIDTEHVYRYFFEFEIQHTTGLQKMNFYVDYGKDVTGNYVKFIDTTDTEVTLYTTDSTTAIKVNNETSVTTSTARVYIGSDTFGIMPVVNYSIADTKYFIKMSVKSVQLS